MTKTKKSSKAIKPEGGGEGGKALIARPLREKRLFYAAFLIIY